MSQSLSIHEYVDSQFRKAFGDPHNTLGKDDHWRLQGSTSQLAINVLLNGTRDVPVIWIFDSAEEDRGVFNAAITSHEHADELITKIQSRTKLAAQRPDGAAG